jgi:hypothetical protein
MEHTRISLRFHLGENAENAENADSHNW